VREWTEQQAVTSVIAVADPGDDGKSRSYSLARGSG